MTRQQDAQQKTLDKMATLKILGNTYNYQGTPSFTESLEPGGSTANIEVVSNGGIPPKEGLFALYNAGGQKIYGGFYQSRPTKVESTRRIYSINGIGLDTLLTNLQYIKGYVSPGALSLDDHLLNLFQKAGAQNPEWPHNLLDYYLPSIEITPFEYEADGITLQQALDEICERINCFWYGDWGAWTDTGSPNAALSRIIILSNDFEGNNAPHNIIVGSGCGDQAKVEDIEYEIEPNYYSSVIVLGKNALLEYAGVPLSTRIEDVEIVLEADDDNKVFPLLEGATRIVFVKKDMALQSLGYMRADEPDNFTDASGNPVDALVDLTQDSPVLKFENAPAGVSGATLTIRYAFEYAIGKATVENRAAQFGSALGVTFPVEKELLIRREDIDLPENAQAVAENEVEKITPGNFKCQFKTKNQGWKSGQGFSFIDSVEGINEKVLSRQVQTTLISSNAIQDEIEKQVQASQQPVITQQERLYRTYRRSLRKYPVKLRLPEE